MPALQKICKMKCYHKKQRQKGKSKDKDTDFKSQFFNIFKELSSSTVDGYTANISLKEILTQEERAFISTAIVTEDSDSDVRQVPVLGDTLCGILVLYNILIPRLNFLQS